jgi:hypothetical protein
VAIAIGAGIALAGTAVSANAASNAADQQSQSAQSSLDLQSKQHDQSLALQQPYTNAGTNALSTMQQLNSGNFSSFTQSPDYKFALDQGTKAMDASSLGRAWRRRITTTSTTTWPASPRKVKTLPRSRATRMPALPTLARTSTRTWARHRRREHSELPMLSTTD